ncbi:MAG: PocR ligand-binding domain-containing protein [Firmicutes bacterium]|nr:PocR ligand-binding domain-containing protein [[Eubacterium] siraeum]MCM1487287.1 PocR ligand-binding domain-containing protein [Bacillota bacterium]
MEFDNKQLTLTEFIDVELLQTVQNAFSRLTGFAALVTDADGTAVTVGSNFSDLCMKYIRTNPEGKRLCEQCDKFGAHQAHSLESSYYYTCHAGMVDFAAPIVVEGEVVGCFIGGQISTQKWDYDKLWHDADKFGIDRDEYIAAAEKIKIVTKEQIESNARSLFDIAKVLSKIAYDRHQLRIKNKEIELAAHAKSDFLANMSHEIRTPMNAVLGMAEMALREEMSPAAREYIHQIMFSGRNLLVIINDILDFSKIESGKMEINEVVYESMSVFNDLASIVNSRISDKKIEFTMDIDPTIPQMLLGDNTRIQQVLINLLNNAVKFTNVGEVHLKVRSTNISSDTLLIKMAVSDTGIGIKSTDLDKLFKSFQQVDSKRNRNIEGTGLGLAITKNLVELMGGTISVDSEYEKGSTFTIQLPQKIAGDIMLEPNVPEGLCAALLINNKYVKAQIIRDLSRINIRYTDIAESETMDNNAFDYLIADEQNFTTDIRKYFLENPKLQCIVISPFQTPNNSDVPRIRVLHKPVYYLNLYAAMGFLNEYTREDVISEVDFSFTAPDANILIVDDNSVNLTVAEGLLKPLKMQISTATSATQAIDILRQVKFDLIFMDHMMPEVDGVETTHIIRRLMPNYAQVPIIALTANAIAGTKEMFIAEGMNDFVAKPIDTKDITAKLRKWLPQEKIIPLGDSEETEQPPEDSSQRITAADFDFLNTKEALELLKTDELFLMVLKEYFISIDKKASSIEQHKENKAWKDYTIEIHALKSTSRQIGADGLADLAAELEQAGKELNTDFIEENHDEAMKMYRELQKNLAPFFPDTLEQSDKKPFIPPDSVEMLDELAQAIEDLDTLLIDEVIEKMSGYKLENSFYRFYCRLKDAAETGDIDACSDIQKQWKTEIVEMYTDHY